MSPQKMVSCEICGKEIPEASAFRIYVENTELIVCPTCYFKYISSGGKASSKFGVKESVSLSKESYKTSAENVTKRNVSFPISSLSTKSVSRRSQQVNLRIVERYEIDPNYPEIIRRAREQKNMSTKDLALKLGESENVIKRIEAGKLVPPIDLAKKIESVLGIKIIIMRIEDELIDSSGRISSELTLGDIITIRKREK